LKYLLTILFVFSFNVGNANTIVVGKDQVVTSLRRAIELAKPYDTIILKKGTYKEGNILINKPISLIGLENPVLDGENKFEILTVSGNNILVKGIHFVNSGYSSMYDYASINLVDSRDVIIENNTIERAYFAIHVGNSRSCIIRNNLVRGIAKSEQTSGNGIHLWKCDKMIVKENIVSGQRDGIYFEFVTNSTISKNTSFGNIRYGLHFMFSNNDTYTENHFKDNGAGVAVMFSHHVSMLGNTFEHNWGPNAYGILLKEISDGLIHRNKFVKNTVGIVMEGTNRINVQMNSFTGNGWALRIQASCDNNSIHHNNFTGNTFDVATNGTMMLNEFYKNYWDRYEGYDLNRDQVGDVPYHPVSLYSMVIEQNSNALLLLRSFIITLFDRAEKAIPSLTPEHLKDEKPLMKPIAL
jgi:nitrous oxidase accessory protein